LLIGSVTNPAPITYNGVYYPAGRLAVISNNSTGPTVAATKKLLTWDLRETWSPAQQFDAQYGQTLPDNNNAQYDGGAPIGQQLEIELFGNAYGFGRTNWNDAWLCLVNLQDAANAIGAYVPYPITSDHLSSRRGAFAPDALKFYFVSKEITKPRRFTGVWSVRMSDKKVRQIFKDYVNPYDGNTVITTSEPAAMKVGFRNFTGLPYDPCMNQVLVNGTTVSGNIGGINAFVDNDTNNAPVYKVIDANILLAFIEAPEPNVALRPMVQAIVADAVGNIYFDIRGGSGPEGIFKYDLQGRLISVMNRVTAITSAIYYLQTTPKSLSISPNRFDIRTVASPYNPSQQILQLMWANSAINGVTGVYVFKPCDFNRDGQITVADMDFFKAQLNKSSGTLPLIADGNTFNDYIKADLNGSGIADGNSDAEPPILNTGIVSACVTEKDMEVLWQFVVPGDTNFNKTIDFKDFAALAANFGKTGVKNWSQGDFNFDDTVDIDDLYLLTEHWLEVYE
jgi:hypothetical protein